MTTETGPTETGMVDLFVIGGGINGAGIARDAAGRGLSVVLCEKDDLAQGTSSRSGKLVHGGLRYLEYYEFRLVREALIERGIDEGRLILADALALADEEAPELLIDYATLTGAARTALGPELPPFYTHDETLAATIATKAEETADPLWRMPLWQPYAQRLSSRVADINNVTTDGFAGSVTAALFLARFVEKAKAYAHFDIFGWTPVEKPAAPVGGEAQGIRALYRFFSERYPARRQG